MQWALTASRCSVRVMLLALVVHLSFAQLTPTAAPPEILMAASSLRDGERERVERALGPIGSLPLYRAELDFNPKARTVTGKVLVTLTPKAELAEVFLRLTPNANTEGAVKLSGPIVNGAAARLEQPDGSLYRIRLPKPAPVGVPVTIELRLAARVPEAEAGSDMPAVDPEAMDTPGGDYGAFSVSPEVSCLAGIIPMVPFVRPNGELASGPSGIGDLGTFDPSNFVVSVIVPRGYAVVSAGNQVGEVPESNNRARFTYAVAAARELPILVTKGYRVETSELGGITVESHFSGSNAKVGKTVLEYATNALRAAQEKLGPYPYRKFRVVEAFLSKGAGGMEFPGVITVASMLYRGTKNPLGLLGMPTNALMAPMLAKSMGSMMNNTLEFTVDHEVAHQYIAMLVGSDPIEEPIADEPLTQAVAVLIMEWENKPALAAEIRTTQVKMAFQMMRMMNKPDSKANKPTSEFTSNIDYAGLIYGKAALLFDAQRALVGPGIFDRALRLYVDENRYKWVTAKTFTATLGRVSGHAPALEKLRQRWWEEKHGDEDIGGLDLESLMEQMTNGSTVPGSAPVGVDPHVLDQYNAAMKALMEE